MWSLSGEDLAQLGTSSIAYNGGHGFLLSFMLGANGFVYASHTNTIFKVVGTPSSTSLDQRISEFPRPTHSLLAVTLTICCTVTQRMGYAIPAGRVVPHFIGAEKTWPRKAVILN